MMHQQYIVKSQQVASIISENWPRLSHEDIALYYKNRDSFYGRLTEKYEISRATAESLISEWEYAINQAA